MIKAIGYIRRMMLMSAAFLMCACNAMHDDLQECETVVRVAVKYDYNIQRADMFHDHAGMLLITVIDADNGTVVRDTVVSNRDNHDAIKTDRDRYFNVEFRNLPLGRKYRFSAMALQRPYDETQAHQADKFVGTFANKGESEQKMQMRLTRAELADAQGRHAVTAPDCGLDTLWMGRSEKVITMPNQPVAHFLAQDTISLVRDTKYLSLTLRQIDAPADITDDQYYIEIVDANGTIGWDNSVLADDKLLYSPHAQWTNEVLDSEGEVTQRSAHYDISFSRLMYYIGSETIKNATLRVYRVSDDEKVADINLPSILAEGRKAFESYNYSPQEYLDREYSYNLDLFLLNGQWQFIDVKINVMAWVIRIQNEKL